MSDDLPNVPPQQPAVGWVPPAPLEVTAAPEAPLYPAPAAGYPDGNPKTAIGLTKPSMSNLPATALIPMMQAFADGAKKYGRLNWREKGVTGSIYYDAAMRHLMAWWDGEDEADDSKVDHLGHAMACLAIIYDAKQHAKLNDDRFGSGAFSALVKAATKKN
ncbi:dATP/dGTP diphosphohydrolase domain-containing protein [Rhizobium leguminosarum]|uniref:dATP/dGTP diphosphohydrolase domain-containing protein n=1 Tax=Rhizobium leguminosarum TaxID=384 RepID=UPI0004B419BC|nr:dATP/dGTP diphosphohydrolase domain-containing protein [Rhizobium leguminosarum]